VHAASWRAAADANAAQNPYAVVNHRAYLFPDNKNPSASGQTALGYKTRHRLRSTMYEVTDHSHHSMEYESLVQYARVPDPPE